MADEDPMAKWQVCASGIKLSPDGFLGPHVSFHVFPGTVVEKITPEWRRLADCSPVFALIWSFMSAWLLFPQPLPSPPPIGCQGIPLECLFPHGVQRVLAVNFHGMGELDHILLLLSVVVVLLSFCMPFILFEVIKCLGHLLY